MRNRLIELISDAVENIRFMEVANGEIFSPAEVGTAIADYLIANNVTILPEGAIILTRAEIEALNKYEGKIKNKWISVEDRLPEVGDDYLVTIKMKYAWETEWEYHTDVATWGCGPEDAWCTLNDWCEGQEVHITHWMPLPEPCESEDTE